MHVGLSFPNDHPYSMMNFVKTIKKKALSAVCHPTHSCWSFTTGEQRNLKFCTASLWRYRNLKYWTNGYDEQEDTSPPKPIINYRIRSTRDCECDWMPFLLPFINARILYTKPSWMASIWSREREQILMGWKEVAATHMRRHMKTKIEAGGGGEIIT